VNQVIEANYPISFREQDAASLGMRIRQHTSVSLIGMKRVGISNFLRFFLTHPQVVETHIGHGKQTFILIDLNNLVEKTLYAFWMLLLKRLLDTIEAGDFSEKITSQSRSTFTQSIQLRDFFFTLEAVRKLLDLIVQEGHYVTLFLLRFDRLQDVITPEFFANIQGLRDTAKHLSYVFTSFRPLHELVPEVFTRPALSGFLDEIYLQPADQKDMQVILSTFEKRYDTQLSPTVVKDLLDLTGGHVQYLQLSLLRIKENPHTESQTLLAQDEQLKFLSEELLSSLNKTEQEVLMNINAGARLSAQEIQQAKYLWDTGMVEDGKQPRIFSPLFASYLREVAKTHHKSDQDFTKKEHSLFTLLQAHEGELVERETIVSAVWPDEEEFGISDWSIDRLVSRVRVKLRAQGGAYKIQTVITRGYKLVRK
jgi:hypothetical protein